MCKNKIYKNNKINLTNKYKILINKLKKYIRYLKTKILIKIYQINQFKNNFK